jgi:predicted nucleotidyltransferase
LASGGAAAGREGAKIAEGIIAKEAKNVLKEAEQAVGRDAARTAGRDAARDIPQGLTRRQFGRFARGARRLRRELGLPKGDLVVQGSRVRGAARAGSDIDVALRVGDREFFDLSERALARAPAGSKLRKTMLRRIRENGQLSSFDLGREFTQARRRLLDPESPFPVQFSVLRRGGKLDTPPFLPLE